MPKDTQADLTERARLLRRQCQSAMTSEEADRMFARALQSEHEAAAARNLFVPGEFGAHSGGTLPFKIDCDALSDADITTLAAEIARRFKFDAVYGVPRGGVRLANALAAYLDPSADKTLIVDDVLTTGRSMEEARARLHQDGATEADPIGVVIFARGPCPPWITPLFATPEASEAASIATRRAAIEECAKYAENQYHMNSFHIAIGIRALASPPAPQEKTR